MNMYEVHVISESKNISFLHDHKRSTWEFWEIKLKKRDKGEKNNKNASKSLFS